MFTVRDVQVIRIVCVMLTGVSVYGLAFPDKAGWRVGPIAMPMTTMQARTVGVSGLIVAGAVYVATWF